MMRSQGTAAAVLSLLLVPGAAHALKDGWVVQVTAARAYLDAGSDDGLAPGAEISLRRAGVEVARCRIEALSARSAACTAPGARVGDTFTLPVLAASEEARLLPPLTSAEQLKAQAAALSAARVTLVDYAAPPRASIAASQAVATVEVGEATWFASSGTPYTATRASVALHGAELGRGFRADVDAFAVHWSSRPAAPVTRFRPSDASQLYVWQAAVSREPGADGLSVAAGRVLPWRIPGATILDGAMAGWRLGAVEVGAFGGLVPDPMTLGITTDRSTAGGYWVFDRRFTGGSGVRDEGRLAFVHSPELGSRFEAETRAVGWYGRAVDLSGSARFGLGGAATAPGRLDAARFELGLRPAPSFRVAGWFAYDGLDVASATEPAVLPGHGRRAEGSVAWEPGSWRLTILGGTATDSASALHRSWVGPIVDWPRLFGARGGLSAGYLEEMGWSDGRSAWVQLLARPWSPLRLFARLSWTHVTALAIAPNELGAALGAVADLGRHFTARLSLYSRAGVDFGGNGTEGGTSLLATVAAKY
jgi:hypothetical protein